MEVREVLPRDAIPSINDPQFDSADFAAADDRVIVVDGDPPKAYPIRILSYHEIVNDTVDGDPVAVTWCPICGSAVVFDRTIDGRELTFGTSGKLDDDALVLYDRETGSEWKQSLGTAISGDLEGSTLRVRPHSITSWGRFERDCPTGMVLQPAGEAARRGTPATVYDLSPYRRYRDDEAFGLYGMRGEGPRRSWERSDLDPKTVVIGLVDGGEARAFSRPWVEAAGVVVADEVDGRAVVVFAADGELHAFEDPGIEFSVTDGTVRGDGAVWDPVSGSSDDGRRLARLPARRMYAFAWEDDHGADTFGGCA